MNSIRCSVPSRIHITLYDMNGELGRVDGGCGFSIDEPSFDFTITPSAEIRVGGRISDAELKEAIVKCIDTVKAKFAINTSASVEVLKIPSSHSGFGSKTSILLAIGQAFLRLNGQSVDFRQLATLLKRGGTSGVGINLIDTGGFVFDGGHSTEEKQLFTPSSATGEVSPAPVLAHFAMPDWDILLVRPKVAKVFGNQEIEFFKQICPVPTEDVDRLARVVLSQLLPGLAEARLQVFCDGINRIQDSVWKSQEIKLYGSEVLNLMREIKSLGAAGVGMSSIGPTLYVLGTNLEDIKEKIETSSNFNIESCILTKPNNTGITFQEN